MNKSESIKNLAVALQKAQDEIGKVDFDSDNPFFHSKYASLGAVIDASKEALTKYGLSVSQPTATNEFGIGVTTLLMHNSGEWIESTITIPLPEPTYVDKNGAIKQNNFAQEAGKIITYLRRYSLASILNLYSDEDTDGDKGTQSPTKVNKTKQSKDPKHKKLNTPMSLEMAEEITGSTDGIRYGDCDDKTLEGKMMGISDGLNNKKITSDEREAYLLKRDAIRTIQAHREQD